MIKRKNPESDNKVGDSKAPVLPPDDPTTHGGIIVGEGRYILKTLQTAGPAARTEMALAALLGEAAKSGYRYIDRIPANQTENILIFELNK